MSKLIDRTGQRYGRLLVLERAEDRISPKGAHTVQWRCKCACGKECVVSTNELRNGDTRSCGCLNKELTTQRNTTHGLSKTKLWHVWSSMKNRCNNPKAEKFAMYGGRGIKVCAAWENDFENFFEWAMKNGYQEGLSIDRIDNAKGYSPENCRWISLQQQNNNKRRTIFVEENGNKYSIAEWCKIHSRDPKTIYARLKRGWPLDKALK